MKKIITLMSLCIFLMLMSPIKTSGDQLADIEAAGEIVIGMDTTYPPFEYLDGTTKVGFSVDFGTALAEKLGVTAVFQTVTWESIIPSLQLGEFDILISSMTITPARDEEIDFSIPYYNSSQGILVAVGNPLGIVDETDLNDSAITIGLQTGTTSDIWATEFATEATLVKLASFSELYLKLDLAEIDVILADFPVIAYAANQAEVDGEVVATFGDVEQFGVGVVEGEPTLLAAINEAIEAMFDDGTYDTVFDAWFGTAATVPADDDDSPFEFMPVAATLFLVGLIVYRRRR